MANITQEFADTMSTVGVHAAYGEPVDLDGTTIIPVALASYGFGAAEGGSDAGSEVQGEGSGGGGGGLAVPVGAYVTRDGYTKFEPNTIALIVVGIPLICVAGRALTKIIRALKR